MPAEPGFVYFVRCLDRVKVGFAQFPHSRMASFAQFCPYPTQLIGQLSGTYLDERRVHDLLRAHHSHGEWFHWCDEVEAVIRSGLPPDDGRRVPGLPRRKSRLCRSPGKRAAPAAAPAVTP
jgi:hypothetical protein